MLVARGGIKDGRGHILFKIGTEMKSETKMPSVFRMNQEISIADCPGFFDSRGDDIEIINSISIGKVLKTPNTCSLVVVMEYPSLMANEGKG